MTDTITRPLPTDWATMKAYLPAPPVSSAVTDATVAASRLDRLIAVAVHELGQLDEQDRLASVALADAACAGGDIAPAAIAAGRPALAHRLAQLRAARDIVTYRMTVAERTDPTHLDWQRQCTQVTAEWQEALATEDPDARFRRLAEFAQRH